MKEQSPSPELPDLDRLEVFRMAKHDFGAATHYQGVFVRLDDVRAALARRAQPYATGGMVPNELFLAGEGLPQFRAQPEGGAPQAVRHAVIEEAAQVFESGAAHNRKAGRTVFAHAQQDRADRLRATLAAPAAQQAESGAQAALLEAAEYCEQQRTGTSDYAGQCADVIRQKLMPKYAALAAQSQGAQANEFEVAIHDCALILDLPKGAGAMDVCRAVNRLATAAQQAAAPGALGDGFALQFSREDWGVIFDGVMLEIDRSEKRKQANSESNSDARAEQGRVILAAIRARSSAPGTPEAPALQPELAVWYGAMPESNGKSNFTAILKRKDAGPFDTCHITIDRSEYPDRVRYEADRVRWLIGEIGEEPFILDYDAEKHSGYGQAAQLDGGQGEE